MSKDLINKEIDCVIVGDIATNCWLYPLETEQAGQRSCVVIDPGEEAELIISRLKNLNWVPAYILLTHGHFDHLAALPDLIEAFAKGAFGQSPLPKIGIHRSDSHYTGKDALAVHRDSFSSIGGNPAYIDALWKPMPEVDILFEEGDTAGPLKVLHIPGHTQGSAAFYDEKTAVLFSGDTLFKGTWGRTDLPGGNEEQLEQSLKRLLVMDADIIVCPGHGAATKISEEADLLKD